MIGRNVSKVRIGDEVILKHNLGRGQITKIIMEWSEGCGQPPECRFPMIQYRQVFTHQLTWCTYRVIDKVNCQLRSIP